MNWRSIRIKWFNREYWPVYVVYFPVFFYWIWLSARAGSLLFFTAANPNIKNGGMFGESKKDILDKLPKQLIPKTELFEPGIDPNAVLQILINKDYSFPLIAKPDKGERGKGVKRLDTPDALTRYVRECKVNFLIQEYIDLPLETGIFYIRIPGTSKGKVTSVTLKELLRVTGDGQSTLEALVSETDRSFLVRNELHEIWANKWHDIPAAGEEVILQNIGNHCRGTKFLNGNRLINESLESLFDKVADKIPGFYFGRFDIRTSSPEDLLRGDFRILELNGAKSEPSHIYDPDVSLAKAYKSLFWHWNMLYKVSVANHKQGVKYLSFWEGWKEFRQFLQYQDLLPGAHTNDDGPGSTIRA